MSSLAGHHQKTGGQIGQLLIGGSGDQKLNQRKLFSFTIPNKKKSDGKTFLSVPPRSNEGTTTASP